MHGFSYIRPSFPDFWMTPYIMLMQHPMALRVPPRKSIQMQRKILVRLKIIPLRWSGTRSGVYQSGRRHTPRNRTPYCRSACQKATGENLARRVRWIARAAPRARCRRYKRCKSCRRNAEWCWRCHWRIGTERRCIRICYFCENSIKKFGYLWYSAISGSHTSWLPTWMCCMLPYLEGSHLSFSSVQACYNGK